MPPVAALPELRHEDFCLPRPGEEAPRVESYPYTADDPATGRSVVTHRVTRCQECGAANYKQIGA